MIRPTSPRQFKKMQKAIKAKGKSFHEGINIPTSIPSIINHMEEFSPCPQNLNRRATQEPLRPAQTPPLQLTELKAAKVNLQIDQKLQATSPPAEARSATSNQQIVSQTQVVNPMAQPQKPKTKPMSPINIFSQENTTTLNLQVDYNLQPATAPPKEADATKLNPPANCQPKINNITTQPQKPQNNLSSPIDIFFKLIQQPHLA